MPAHAQDATGGIAGELERVATTSSAEKLQYSGAAVEEMRTDVKLVSKLLEAARKEGVVEKLQCLNTRLTAMKALLTVSEAADANMHTALWVLAAVSLAGAFVSLMRPAHTSTTS